MSREYNFNSPVATTAPGKTVTRRPTPATNTTGVSTQNYSYADGGPQYPAAANQARQTHSPVAGESSRHAVATTNYHSQPSSQTPHQYPVNVQQQPQTFSSSQSATSLSPPPPHNPSNPQDFHVASQLPINNPNSMTLTPTPSPFYTHYPEVEPKPPNKSSSFSCLALVCFALILLLLTGLGVAFFWHSFRPEENEHARGEHLVLGPLTDSDSSTESGSSHHWVIFFETGPDIQEWERHPDTGGIENLLNFSSLVDYNVCCTTATHKFICVGGGQSNDWFSKMFMEQDEVTEDIYLRLKTNSKEVVSVTCKMILTIIT